MTDLIWLQDPSAAGHGPGVLGGKGHGLARLAQFGLPTLPGVVVSADHHDLDSAATAVHRGLAADRYAVRSSAPAEDGDQRSMAGALPSLLRVPPEQLAQAMATVRAAGEDRPIPVVVMPFIEPDAGGVAFSTDPLTGGTDVVISAVEGHHAGITDGTDAGVTHRVGDGGRRRRVRRDGPAVLSDDVAREVAQLTRRAEEVVGTAVDVEFLIEDGSVVLLQARPITTFPVWDAPPGTWEYNAEYSTSPATALTGQWFCSRQTEAMTLGFAEAGGMLQTIETRLIGGYIYSRAVVAGAPAGATGGPPPAPVLGLLSRLIPAQRRRVAQARRFLLGDGFDQARRRARVVDWDGLGQRAARAASPDAVEADAAASLATIVQVLDVLLLEHFRWIPTVYGQAVGATGRALEAVGFPNERAVQIVAGPQRAGASTAVQGAKLTRAADAISRQSAARDLVTPEPPTEAAAAQEVLDSLAAVSGEVGAAVAALLDHARVQLMGFDVSAPTLADTPALLFQALRQEVLGQEVLRQNGSRHGSPQGDELSWVAPPDRGRSPVLSAETLLAEVPAHLHAAVRTAWEEHHQRDRHGLAFVQAIGALRVVALELGRRFVEQGVLSAPAVALSLEPEELRQAAADGALSTDVAERAALRHADRQRQATWHPPATIGGSPGPPPDLRYLPRAARAVNERMAWAIGSIFGTVDAGPTAVEDGVAHHGRAASPGQVEGVARVVLALDDLVVLQPGEILVCPHTGAAWMSLLQQCDAVVTVSGGPLSHAAIVARELGVPAVCGVTDATRLLHDGDLIRVDGDRGVVTALHV